MTLFDEWLAKTDELQREAYGNDLPALDPETRAKEFTMQGFAAIAELVEMSNEIGWKPWATSRHLNREKYIAEGVDVLHFVANLLLLAGATDSELNEAYLRKMETNRKRQLDGYDGVSDKCTQCGRALDDKDVSCTASETVVLRGHFSEVISTYETGYCEENGAWERKL